MLTMRLHDNPIRNDERRQYTRRFINRCCVFFLALIISVASLSYEPVQALDAANGDGALFYGQSANTTPQWRTYQATNNFSAAAGMVTGAVPLATAMRTSPTKQEAVAGYMNSGGILQVMCYNGTSWTNEWSVNVGGNGTTKRFDIAYETTSGDVMVLYSANSTTNEMAYRTKPGSSGCGSPNWAAGAILSAARTSGIVQWVKMAWDKRAGQNLITAIWADANRDLSAAVWSGSAWGNEPASALETTLEVASAAQDVDPFDVEYESSSGNIMVSYAQSGASAAGLLEYYRCTGGIANCTWSAQGDIPTVADGGTVLVLSSDPLSNKMALAAIDNSSADLSIAYWSGSDWTGFANQDTTTEIPVAGSKPASVTWLNSETANRYVVTYDDASGGGISWYVGNGTSPPAKQSDIATNPLINDIRYWYASEVDPFDTGKAMLVITDATNGLFAKRVTMNNSADFAWTNADGGAALEAGVGQATASPFSFAYWRYVPAIPSGTLMSDIVDGAGASITSPSLSMAPTAVSPECQTTTGTFGTSSQKVRVTNTTAAPSWSLSVAATSGATANWSSGLAPYDFNDPAGSPSGCGDGADADSSAGQLSVNPAAGIVAPQEGCSAVGITLGSASKFNQAVTDNITLMAGSGSAQTNCYWDLTNVAVSQHIPPSQAAGVYNMNMTITVSAN